jgi:hypothetical protein
MAGGCKLLLAMRMVLQCRSNSARFEVDLVFSKMPCNVLPLLLLFGVYAQLWEHGTAGGGTVLSANYRNRT